MNKAEFVKAVAKNVNSSQVDAERFINAVLDEISNALANGDSVQFIGFGSFSPKNRAARIGINPQTKEKITIPESKVVLFKAGTALKSKLNAH